MKHYTVDQLFARIPKKYHDRLERECDYDDGLLFVYTKKGWCAWKNPGQHIITAETMAELKSHLHCMQVCDCEDCDRK